MGDHSWRAELESETRERLLQCIALCSLEVCRVARPVLGRFGDVGVSASKHVLTFVIFSTGGTVQSQLVEVSTSKHLLTFVIFSTGETAQSQLVEVSTSKHILTFVTFSTVFSQFVSNVSLEEPNVSYISVNRFSKCGISVDPPPSRGTIALRIGK